MAFNFKSIALKISNFFLKLAGESANHWDVEAIGHVVRLRHGHAPGCITVLANDECYYIYVMGEDGISQEEMLVSYSDLK